MYYVQGQQPLGASATTTSGAALYTGSAAYDTTVLTAPAVPQGLTTAFDVQVQSGATPPSASIMIPSAFYGFSIEFSVINVVIGSNASHIQVPFLNLMSNIVQRAGSVHIRVGGNTQERAVLVDTIPGGKILEKDKSQLDPNTPTATPPTVFTTELLYMLANASSLVNVKWYLGIPFNDTNWRLAIATEGQKILGSNLLGLQAGNEPDQYGQHGARSSDYNQQAYVTEFKSLVDTMNNDPAQSVNRHLLLGPSLSTSFWTNQQIWDLGYVDQFNDNLAILTTEKYPDNNCAALYPSATNPPLNPQDMFPKYLDHSFVVNLVAEFRNDTAYAVSKQKPFVMFETNTASCSGFPGVSDSFGAALWALDYGMQMAANNFSGALLHVGGQNSYYNPFTPPPTNQSAFHQWTIGPVYYSTVVMAEALGKNDNTQVYELGANSGSIYTPAYAFYQNNKPVRIGLFNYVTDPTGNSAITAQINVMNVNQADETPQTIKVKHLSAQSVSQKGDFMWANQTLGNHFDSDGRFAGQEVIETVTCVNGKCPVTVPAPGFALVFLSDDAMNEPNPTATYATTAYTKVKNTATVDPVVLATSNGHSGLDTINLGSTSSGSNGAVTAAAVSGTVMLAALFSAFLFARLT